MKIIPVHNPRKHRFVYHVDDDGATLATLDTLTDAALIVRYLSGAGMPDDDAARALAIMEAVDAARADK